MLETSGRIAPPEKRPWLNLFDIISKIR